MTAKPENIVWDALAEASNLKVASIKVDDAGAVYRVTLDIVFDSAAHQQLLNDAASRRLRISSSIQRYIELGLLICFGGANAPESKAA
jgi:hypothetical protein